MFKCDCCKKDIGPGISPKRIVLAYRPRTYEAMVQEGRNLRLREVGNGFEIAKEANACEECAPIREAKNPNKKSLQELFHENNNGMNGIQGWTQLTA